MKMRKLLAVVMAVVLAISAMAISVFADETYQIPLAPTSYTSSAYSTTYEFTLPAYAFYGYLTAGDTLTITLPTNLSYYGYAANIDYYLSVNGVEVKIADVTPTPVYFSGDASAATFSDDASSVVTYEDGTTETGVIAYYKYTVTEVTVEVGYFARNYSSSYNAMIPQSTLVSDSTTMVIKAVVSNDSNGDGVLDSDVADGAQLKWGKSDYTIPTGYYYDSDLAAWLPGLTANSSSLNYWGYGDIVYAEITDTDDTVYTYPGYNWDSSYMSWDYATNNENYSDPTAMSVTYNYTDAAGAAQTSVAYLQDIADFGSVTSGDTSVSGSTTSTTVIEDTSASEVISNTLYWDHTLYNRALVMNAATTEGATAKVVVDLSNYGTGYIYGYAVYTLEASAETVDSTTSFSGSDLWYTPSSSDGYYLGLYNYIAGTYVLSGTSSALVFDIDTSLLYNTTYGLYNGSFVITQQATLADTTDSGYNYSNDWYGTSLSVAAGDVYLELTFPADDDTVVDNDDPVEDTNSETEDDELTVDDTDDTTAEPETNPTTGIVLALVPMAVAAAAAVASKRR